MLKHSYLLLALCSTSILAQETETIIEDPTTTAEVGEDVTPVEPLTPEEEATQQQQQGAYEAAVAMEPKQAHLWANTDFAMGIAMGLYVPMNLYARNEDCYSLMFDFADELINYHEDFNVREFTKSALYRVSALTLVEAFTLRSIVSTCRDQKDEAEAEGWFTNYERH